MSKGQRKANGSFALSESPSHLLKRCTQYFGDLYAHEAGSNELTKQQFTVLAALEHNDGVSQTALVEITGIDRSTLAEMVRRMLDKGLLSRERTEEDQRANAVAISPSEVSFPRRPSMNHSAFPTGFISLPVQPSGQCNGYSPGPFDGNCRIGGSGMPAALIAPG